MPTGFLKNDLPLSIKAQWQQLLPTDAPLFICGNDLHNPIIFNCYVTNLMPDSFCCQKASLLLADLKFSLSIFDRRRLLKSKRKILGWLKLQGKLC